MKTNVIRNIVICLAASLLSAPLVCAQDLSKYRDFSLGTSLIELTKQVNGKPTDASVIHQDPALIQELTWWPTKSYQAPASSEAVQSLLFSFYNGELYKIMVTYENSSTQGLTSEDMVRAISTKYGVATVPVVQATVPVVEATPSTLVGYSSTGVSIASWEDSQYSVTLSQIPLSNTFQLVMYSRQLNGQADAAIAEAIKQSREEAPQREIARVKQEAEDLETMRQANVKAFQP
jgi:hypothetical protein